jgi:cell wall-associated NlpC family hydrolase
MIERQNEALLTSRQHDLDALLQRANDQRHRYRRLATSSTSIPGSNQSFTIDPVQTLSKFPSRYILHVAVALSVPVAVGLSQLPTRQVAHPVTQTAVMPDAPIALGPIQTASEQAEPLRVGDPPLPESDAIPVPLSLTSRSAALAPPVLPGSVLAGDVVQLRSGPGAEYDTVARINGGGAVQVVGRYGDWLQVRTAADATTYWAPVESVAMADGAVHAVFEVQETELPAVPAPRVATVAEDNLNLRDGPGENYLSMTKLASGQEVRLLQQHEGWLHIAGEDFNGWVSGEFLSFDQAALDRVPVATQIPSADPLLVGVVNESQVNLRSGPGTSYASVGSIDAGIEINLIERHNDWYHVETAGGEQAWVFVGLVDTPGMVQRRVPVASTVPTIAEAAEAPAVGEITAPAAAEAPVAEAPAAAPAAEAPAAPAAPAIEVEGAAVTAEAEASAEYGIAAEPVAPAAEPAAPAAPAVELNTDASTLARPGENPVVSNNSEANSPAKVEPVDEPDVIEPTAPGQAVIDPAIPEPSAPDEPDVIEEPAAPSTGEAEPAAEPAAPAAPAAPAVVPASGDVASYAVQFVGHAYVYGGASPGAFDCSGLTMYVYAQHGVYLPHNAAAQFSTAHGAPVTTMANLAPGDLVFFAGTAGPGISHVGVYIGGGRFVHAMAPGLGVQVSGIYEGYWVGHYAGAIRPYR